MVVVVAAAAAAAAVVVTVVVSRSSREDIGQARLAAGISAFLTHC